MLVVVYLIVKLQIDYFNPQSIILPSNSQTKNKNTKDRVLIAGCCTNTPALSGLGIGIGNA